MGRASAPARPVFDLSQRTGCLPPGHRSCTPYLGSVLSPKGVNHLYSGGSALERLLLRTNDLANGQTPTPPSAASAAHSPQANWSTSQ
jgi:hypothetical protein